MASCVILIDFQVRLFTCSFSCSVMTCNYSRRVGREGSHKLLLWESFNTVAFLLTLFMAGLFKV